MKTTREKRASGSCVPRYDKVVYSWSKKSVDPVTLGLGKDKVDERAAKLGRVFWAAWDHDAVGPERGCVGAAIGKVLGHALHTVVGLNTQRAAAMRDFVHRLECAKVVGHIDQDEVTRDLDSEKYLVTRRRQKSLMGNR